MGKEATSGGLKRYLPGVSRTKPDDDGRTRWLAVGAALLLVLAPLLPFLAVAWLLSRTLRGVRDRVSWD